MSWSTFWKFFERLRLIPVPDSRWGNRISNAVWVLIAMGSFIPFQVLYYKDNDITKLNVSKQIAYILIDVILPIQSISGILLIALFVNKQRHLVQTTLITIPKRPWFFTLMTAVQLASAIFYIFAMATVYHFTLADLLCLSSAWVVNVIVLLTLNLVLGVFANSLSSLMNDTAGLETLENFEEIFVKIIKEFGLFKHNLQPITLMIFISNVILVTIMGYLLIADQSYQTLVYLGFLMLQMSYITYILDDCYTEFKSTVPRLR